MELEILTVIWWVWLVDWLWLGGEGFGEKGT